MPVTREALLDPEAAVIRERKGLAWRVIERLLRQRVVDDRALRAAQITLDRYEPAARPILQATVTGPVVLMWSSESPSPILPAHSSESSTTPGSDNGHGPASPSAIDDLESL